jgi:hypothetical protein
MDWKGDGNSDRALFSCTVAAFVSRMEKITEQAGLLVSSFLLTLLL